MFPLDMKTVAFSHAISSAICLVIMFLLWQQNRNRYKGIGLWLLNSIMQFIAIVLIAFRGRIPDFASIVIGNTLIIGGIFLLYVGIEKYVGKQISQIYNSLFLLIFALVHSYYTYIQPSLLARNINVALGILLFATQISWLLLYRVSADQRIITRSLGYAACGLAAISMLRIVLDVTFPVGNSFLGSNVYDTLIVLSYQMSFIVLTFSLILMVNRRLVEELEQDIIERKKIDETLRASEEEYRLLFASNPAPMLVYDTETLAILAVNEFAIDHYGYSREEFLSMTVRDIRPPEEIPFLYQVLNTALGPLRKVSAVTHRKKDGSLIYVDISGHEIEFEGHPAMLVLCMDITERLQAENALRESEEKYRLLFENMAQGVFYQLTDGQLVDVNSAALEMLGVTRDQFLGMTSHDPAWQAIREDGTRLQPEQYPSVVALQTGKTVKDFELAVYRPATQDYAWIIVNAIPQFRPGEEKPYQAFVTLHEITERKQADRALRESETFSRAIVNNSPIGISVRSKTGQLLSANEAWKRIWAISETEVLEDQELDRKSLQFNERDDYLKPYQADLRCVYEQGGHLHLPELKTTHPRPGGAEWVAQHFYALKDEHNQVERVVILTEDITERKRTEIALRENEDRLRTIFDTSQAGIILVGPKGIITFANQRMADMFGCSLAELIGSAYPEHVHPDQRQVGDERMRQLIAGQIDSVAFERHYIRKDGSGFWGFLSGRRHEDEAGNLISLVGIIADITESKQAEEDIRAALHDKEVLLRELYHRTKNNMQVISSMLNLEIGQTENEEIRQTLRDMDNRIRSMALVHQKLYQSQNLSSLDLRDYLSDLVNLMAANYQVIPERVTVSIEAESTPVLIDTAIPCGLIINEILSNALKYAFPDKRKGDVRIRLTHSKESQGNNITLEISDNGIGVPPEKDLRQSNTLGIQTIFGIAHHQLKAKVDLETSCGVTWRIRFTNDLYASRV